MSPFAWALIGGLILVVALQLVNRILGALCGLLWTLALVFYGWQQMQAGAEVRFFFVKSDPATFAIASTAFIGYSVYVLVQAIRRRPTRPRRDAGTH